VTRGHDPSEPSLPTKKRLFALSSNRCAFPRCTATLIEGSTVVGKICHIKGARLGSARYDAQQSAAERHGFDNLILMCGRHHDVIDADEEAYTVDRLLKMKAEHESKATPVADDFAERAAHLLIDQSVLSVNQSGGITAYKIYVNSPPARDEAADRHAALARIGEFHQERTKKLIGATPQIPVLDGGRLLMHVVPMQTFDTAQPEAFAKICADPCRLAPIADRRARDYKINFDGLLTGSNGDGLGKPQRAYVYAFRSGTVEAVVSSLARGRDTKALQLPNIQCMIIHYARVYATILRDAGIQPPFAIYVSLAGVKTMRLLQDFIGTAVIEDLPYGHMTEDVLCFGHVVFDEVPADDNESAKKLLPLLNHLANTAQLASSPYFDEKGNYTLKPAQPAG
jgi:hypothetical protein